MNIKVAAFTESEKSINTYVAFFYIYHLSAIKALYEFKLLVGINCCHLKAHLCEI